MAKKRKKKTRSSSQSSSSTNAKNVETSKASSEKASKKSKKKSSDTSTTDGPLPEPKFGSLQWALPYLVALFGLLLYANTFGHLYAIDDNLVIYGHDYVEQGLKGTKGIFTTPFTYGTSKLNDRGYRPITLMVFALEIELFGKNAFFAQHFIHVLIFALSCFFLFLLLRRLFWKKGYLFPLLVSLLYAAHPIHTEVVANLKSLDEILGFFLGFVLTTLMLLKYFDTKKPVYLGLSYFIYLVGMFSKENVITYLVIIPLTLFVFTEIGFKRILKLCLPFVAIAAFYVVVRESILGQYPIPEYDMMQNILMGAKSWVVRYSTAMLIMLKYVILLFLPHPLAWDYSYNQIPLTDLSDWRVWAAVFVYVAMLAYALWKIKDKNLYAYGILFFLTTMSVNSNLFIMTNCTLGERFLYAPSLGWCIIVVAALFAFFNIKKYPKLPKVKAQLSFVMLLALIFMGAKTITRNVDWKDSLSVSLADIKTNPNSIRVVSTLAAVYLALAKRKDTPPQARKQLYGQIIPLAHKILKLSPGHKEATYNLGICYYFLGDYDKAEKAFNTHLKLHPSDVKAYNNLGGLYYFRKDYNTAMTYFKKFVNINKQKLAKLQSPIQVKEKMTKLRRDKEIKELREELKKAINNLGVVTLNKLRNPDAAIPYFKEAMTYDPTYAEPLKRIGDAYVIKGKVFKGIEFYKKASKLNPKRYGNVGPLIQRAMTRFRRRGRGFPGRGMRPGGFPGRGRFPGGFPGRRGPRGLPPGFKFRGPGGRNIQLPEKIRRQLEKALRNNRRHEQRRAPQKKKSNTPPAGYTPNVSMPPQRR
ncbi:MAG: tetratricopeptide repeat protein [Deltaproteobacteria bacterium]|nr:MAG: tetratricopeptide repeat protein [Deltaproteobacteria bacterium]